jgi:hypothetical protein
VALLDAHEAKRQAEGGEADAAGAGEEGGEGGEGLPEATILRKQGTHFTCFTSTKGAQCACGTSVKAPLLTILRQQVVSRAVPEY